MMFELEFSKILRDWYRKTGRKLPWRETKDPYKIWISEIILQQTRVDQGLPYYIKFVEAFPTVNAFAKAPQDKILRYWQGLGYYSRARNMHVAARQVVENHQGKFPEDFQSLKNLKGVGDYTAAAIASFAFNLPHPVVDGNVYRFLSRLSGNPVPIDSSKGKKFFAEMALELLDPSHASEHNQAMMEMGAVVCKPVAPLCDECPFSMACHAFIYSETDRLPVKEKKQSVRRRYFHYFFFSDERHTYILQREKKDIWQGLFEFPLLEMDDESIDIKNIKLPKGLLKKGMVLMGNPWRQRHLLSHQELITHFWKISSPLPLPDHPYVKKVSISELNTYAFPQLLVKFLQHEQLL